MAQLDYTYTPTAHLIPVFSPNHESDITTFTLSLTRAAAAEGKTALMIDCQDGALMETAGIIYNKTLTDVVRGTAQMRDISYVTSNEHFTAIAAGDAPLEHLLGSIAALSLDYDWVFVGLPVGCTPAHTCLANAADSALIVYDTAPESFMRAYWLIDAVRQRHPRFDPLLISDGDDRRGRETAEILAQNVAEFLGAPPPYCGHSNDATIFERLFSRLTDLSKRDAA